MTLLVLSAHLDDAVLSCGGRLDETSVVVTVFAGVPPPDTVAPPWDRLTGTADPHRRVLARREEDQRALGWLGARSVQLDFLDGQYRQADADLAVATAQVRRLMDGVTELWVPAAIGGHPDHVAAREIGLAAGRQSEAPVRLYADLPYSLVYGWPASVTGSEPDPYLDADCWLHDELVATGLCPDVLMRTVHRLDDASLRRKRKAMEEYASQLPVLDAQCGGRLRDDAVVRFEVSWET